jgi:hypothetical protein
MLVIVPVPVPDLTAVRMCVVIVKVAVTVVAAVIVTVQVPVPEQPPPDQPVKLLPDSGVAVSTTEVLKLYGSLQSAPQLMPAGELVTDPVPEPALITEST